MKPPRIKALIFDMDGVIVDSEPMHLLAYQEILGRYSIEYTEKDNREFLGCKDYSILEILRQRYQLDKSTPDLLKEKEAVLARLLKNHSVPRPGLLTTLQKAHTLGLSMAIASSATLPTILLVACTLKIKHYFQSLTSGDEVAEGKPAPDVFLLAAMRLGIDPVACLVIEDTLNGIRAAKKAGMYCVAIPCEATRHQDHSPADAHLESLEHLNLEYWCGLN